MNYLKINTVILNNETLDSLPLKSGTRYLFFKLNLFG